jgi:hypothetical protein
MSEPPSSLKGLVQEAAKRLSESAAQQMRNVRFEPTVNFDFAKHIKPIDQQRADSVFEEIRDQLQSLEKALQPDQELFIYYAAGFEVIRVVKIIRAGWHLLALEGCDEKQNSTVVLCHINSLHLTFKVLKKDPNQKRTPIGFHG